MNTLKNQKVERDYLDIVEEVESKEFPAKNGFKAMILQVFNFIEMLTFTLFETLWKFSSNSLVKTISLVIFCVLYEIFIYLILALSCVFITIILQTYDMINHKERVRIESNADKNEEQANIASK